jgi:hypothetical protein
MEKELDEVEKEMNNPPADGIPLNKGELKGDLEIIEKYTSLLETFNNIGGYNYNNQIHNVANGMQILHLLDRKLSEVSG